MFGQENQIIQKLNQFFQYVDWFNYWTGRVVSFLSLVMMLTVAYDVVARYFFGSPTLWSLELNIYLLCAYVLLSGGSTLLGGGHVRVDIFWSSLSSRGKATADIITSVLFFVFCAVMVWKGSEMALRSFIDHTTSSEAMEWPLFPSHVIIPIGGFMLGLQGLAKLWRDILMLRGRAS